MARAISVPVEPVPPAGLQQVARAVAGLPVVRAAMAVLVALLGLAPRGGDCGRQW